MRKAFALLIPVFLLVGCAKFPSNTAANNFTRIRFRMSYNGPVDTNYLYFVAIRTIRASDTDISLNGPIPVVTTGSKNGFVEGRPTHFIEFNPSAAELYLVNRFGTRAPTDDDPNPINLASFVATSAVFPGSGIDPRPSGANTTNGNQLGFEISTQDLSNGTQADAQSIIAIQFNILAMNRKALNSGDVGSRVMDALGNQSTSGSASFNTYRQISLLTSNLYENSSGANPFPETSGDTFNGNLPAVDLTDYEVEIRTP